MNTIFSLPIGELIKSGLTVHFVATFALFLGILLGFTILFSTILERLTHIPLVAGQLIAGLILGPSLINITSWKIFNHPILINTAGVSISIPNSELFLFVILLLSSALIVAYLLWMAGYETDIQEMFKVGPTALMGGVFGALIPIAVIGFFCWAIGMCTPLQAVGFGLIFAATSVSIPIVLLLATKRMHLRSSKVTLGAAVIDDIFAVILLSLFFVSIEAGLFGAMTPTLEGHGSLLSSIFSLLGVSVFLLGIGYLIIVPALKLLNAYGYTYLIPVLSTIIMLLYFACAELLGGLAGITGAYFAGIIIRKGDPNHIAYKALNSFINAILLPIFLGSIGLQVNISHLSLFAWCMVVILLVLAIITKLLGCYGATQLSNWLSSSNWTLHETYLFGASMVARGEVGLVVATILYAGQLISMDLYGIAIVVIVLTTIVSPIMLSLGFSTETEADHPISYNLGLFPLLGLTAPFNALRIIIEQAGYKATNVDLKEGETLLVVEKPSMKIIKRPGKGIIIEGNNQDIKRLLEQLSDKLTTELLPVYEPEED